MEYTVNGTPVTPLRRRNTLESRIRENVIPNIPSDSWQETSDPLPFQRDTSIQTIVANLLEFTTGDSRTNAVYVLECIHTKNHQQTAAVDLGKPKKQWRGKVDGADRLLYVGVTANLLRRMDQHFNDARGEAAHFTTVFPPIRVLDVEWYRSYHRAEKAEILTAELLREEFPNDYVSQPA